MELPWTGKFKVKGETKYSEEKHMNDARCLLNEK